jgi:imidazolonepropionase-like amidohydrolase
MSIKAFVNGLVIDGSGSPPIQSGVVIVEDDRIKAVGPVDQVTIPDKAEKIEAAGKTVMPGLIDAHMHVTTMPQFLNSNGHIEQSFVGLSKLRACLAFGTTTVANMGGCEENVILRNAIEQGQVGPCARMLVGAMINSTGGHVRGRTADGPWEIRKAVREMVMHNVDFIKTAASGGFMWEHEKIWWEDYTVEELKALVSEAHSKGKRVAVHAHSQPGLNSAIEAGCDSIQHGALIDDEALQGILDRKLYYIPTLYITSSWVLERPNLPAHMKERMTEAHPIHREGVRKAHQMGITIGTGTDGNPGDVMKELAELVQCGLSPLEAITAGTRNAADALAILDRVGTLESGKKADVIMIDGDPLKDISILMEKNNIVLVMKDGKVEIIDEAHKQYFHPGERE